MSWHMQRSVATSAGPGKGFSAMSSGGSSRIPISSASGSGQLFAAPPRFGSRSLVMDSKRRTASTTGNSRCGIVSSGSFGGSAQNISSLGIQQVTINQALLTPLNLNIDPSISVVRKEEREKIKTLNNKFASYIDKVRFLEQQNKVLETKWSLLQQQHQPSKSSDFDSIFNAYISSLTNGLGTLNRDKGTLDRHLQTMKEQAEDFKKRYEDELKTRDGAENAFVSVKKEVDATFLTNTQLQTRQCALEEELTFLRHIFEQVLSGIKQQGFETSVILSMDNNRVLDFNDTIADVKKQFEDTAKRSKDEAESAYQTKYRQLQDAASLQGDDLRKSKNEVSELSRSIQRLKNEIENLIKKNSKLQLSIEDAENQGEIALRDGRNNLEKLEAALQKAKQEMAHLLREYQMLMNFKLALEVEIATYRLLLEGEESRVNGEIKDTVSVSVLSGANTRAALDSRADYSSGFGVGSTASAGSVGGMKKSSSNSGVKIISKTESSNFFTSWFQ